MSFRTRTASSLALLTALCLGVPLAVQAGCEGRVGALMPVTPVTGTEDLPPALAELIARHRGESGASGVSTSRRSEPLAGPEPTLAALPPGTRIATVAPAASAASAALAR